MEPEGSLLHSQVPATCPYRNFLYYINYVLRIPLSRTEVFNGSFFTPRVIINVGQQFNDNWKYKKFFSCGVATQRQPLPPHSWSFYITHNDASYLVGLLWTSDQLVVETTTLKHTTLTTERHPCPRSASSSSGQSFWLIITRFRVRFPALTWGFSLWGEDPHGDHGLGS